MSRPLRLIAPGDTYHVTARGNFKQDIFFCPEDRLRYLALLHKRSQKSGVRLLGWCLMTNHVHLLVVPEETGSLSRCMQRLQGEYSASLNRCSGRPSGHIWQNRYYSCPVSSERFAQVLAYIELNPYRAGLVRKPEEYLWSTASIRAGRAPWPTALDPEPWASMYTPAEWHSVLELGLAPEDEDAIRTATRYGVPYGNRAFVSRYEILSGRRLQIRPPGRPRKAPLEAALPAQA